MRVFVSLVIVFGLLVGNEQLIQAPKKITPEWEESALGIKYKVTTLENAVSEMVDGLIDDTFGKEFILNVQKEI